MKIAVLSDIHSNCFALRSVLDDMKRESCDLVIVLGDFFGYYPWATECFRMLRTIQYMAIVGNHDQLVLDVEPPKPIPPYWSVAKLNEEDLLRNEPEALKWLNSLPTHLHLILCGKSILCYHGTPENPMTGRLYPDSTTYQSWAPKANEILLLGHTHYPMTRTLADGGLIANPGSVGQPRDFDPRASWGILHLPHGRFEVRRVAYDVDAVVNLLLQMDWYVTAINGLRKHMKTMVEENDTKAF